MRARTRPRLVRTLILFMLLVGTIPLSISSWMLISINRSTISRDQQIIQSQLAQHLANEVSSYLRRCLSEIDSIRISVESGEGPLALGSLQRPEAQHLLEAFIKKSEAMLAVRILDPSGRGIKVGYAIDDPRLENLLDEAFYQGMRDTYKYVSLPVFIERTDQLLGVVSRTAIENGQPIGVVSAIVKFDPIRRLTSQGSFSGNEVLIVDPEGKLIVHSDVEKMRNQLDLSGSEMVKEMRKMTSQVTTTRRFVDNMSGHSMLGTIVNIPEVGWGVIVQTPEEVAFYPVTEMIMRVALWIAIAIASAVALSLLFSRQISVPIRLLVESTRRIANGDFSNRVQIAQRNELGQLAEHFNTMAEKVQGYIEDLKRAINENKELFMGSIAAITAAIDEKDPYTRGHTERVSRYAVEIARALGLPEDELEKVKIAALLHDVGKIGIEDAILKKPAKFTPEEYEIMKQHPLKTAHIMSSIPQLRDLVPAASSHHEQFDGKGYPYGLKGEEIPLIGRIIAVADCFDAMTLKRIYQPEFDVDLVLEKIRGWAGTRYDPKVVDALMRAYYEGRIRVPKIESTYAEQPVEEKKF